MEILIQTSIASLRLCYIIFRFVSNRFDRSLAFLILEIQCINHFVSPDQYTILIIFILQFDCGIILELLTYIISCYILQMTKNYC